MRDSVIIHKFEVLSSVPDDMTIGRDLMSSLGLPPPPVQESANDESTLDPSDELLAGDDCAIAPEDLLPQHLETALQHSYLKLLGNM
ncbi:hypothetical protein GQ600_3373 [Phytophthora cactorum]|nr:hypothetical protein GQ600_3373 [Phytophthora cactorum]